MVKEVPFVTFPTTLYFIPGPSLKFTTFHTTSVWGQALGGGGGGEEVLGVSAAGGGGGGEESFSGSTDFLAGGEACLANGAGRGRFIIFSNSS